MRIKTRLFARKIRQLKYCAKQLSRLLPEQQQSRHRLERRLKSLYQHLRGYFSKQHLQRHLAGSTLALGLLFSQSAHAQVTYASPQSAPFGITSADDVVFPYLADIDNDGDLDVIGTTYSYGGFDGLVLAYWENTGDSEIPQFGTPEFNPFGIISTGFSNPVCVDLDNDGDLDLITGQYDSPNLLYFENTGTAEAPAFEAPQLNPFGLEVDTEDGISFIALGDADGDGDYDLISDSYYESDFKYYENTGTPENPAFASPNSNMLGSMPEESLIMLPVFADVDDDGDMDLFYQQYNEDSYVVNYAFMENTLESGTPSFASPVLDPFGLVFEDDNPRPPAFGDLDNDGDTDLLLGASYGMENPFLFFENLLISNGAPTAANNTIAMDENTTYVFQASDFSFTDPDQDDFAELIITDQPNLGALTFDGIPVVLNQEIDPSQINLLTYTPPEDMFGNNFTEFSFRVSDGMDLSVETYTITFNVLEVVSVANINLIPGLKLFPNPVSHQLTVDMPGLNEAVDIQISNANGQLVFQNRREDADTTPLLIETSAWPAGLYNITFSNARGLQTQRFVKL